MFFCLSNTDNSVHQKKSRAHNLFCTGQIPRVPEKQQLSWLTSSQRFEANQPQPASFSWESDGKGMLQGKLVWLADWRFEPHTHSWFLNHIRIAGVVTVVCFLWARGRRGLGALDNQKLLALSRVSRARRKERSRLLRTLSVRFIPGFLSYVK